MRILIDECLDWRLGRAFSGHDAISVQRMGWSGVQNGELLALAEQNNFNAFLAADRNLSFQQNISQHRVAVVILEGGGLRLRKTLPLIPKVLALLPTLKAGQVVRVGP